MNIRILMVGNDAEHLFPEAVMLKERGLQVYTSSELNIDEMVDEVKPDVVYFNPDEPGTNSTKVYHHMLDSVQYSSIPVIYSLLEDDTYLVNRKRTISRDKRNIIADNIVDGIRMALSDKLPAKNRKSIHFKPVYLPYSAKGA